ncbi:MAG TPA: DUF3800 domain-containing protein [Capsulimonadaceae bacterium]|jgi:hypothetical protein
MQNQVPIRHYYLDEAGDGTLFDHHGRILVGSEGCSNYFMLGMISVADPVGLSNRLETLRQSLITDPYFEGVPSFDLAQRKTAIGFHAKDDLPEVRWAVMQLLRREDLGFFAVVSSKKSVLKMVHEQNSADPTYRYHPNQMYDYQVQRLLRGRLHRHSSYHIHFAGRGKADRTAALKAAVILCQSRYIEERGIASTPALKVSIESSRDVGGLQAADYFLWTLQRFYERGEDRYMKALWPRYRMVIDTTDNDRSLAGRHYTQKRPLTLAVVRKY